MLRSEINAVMTGGFATVAGTVLGAYIGYSACKCKYPIFLNSGYFQTKKPGLGSMPTH